MPAKERFQADIPEGYRIFESEFSIAGVHHYKQNFFKAMKKGIVSIKMKRDRSNKVDANAIQVIASRKRFFGKTEVQIGHIPALVASRISDAKTYDSLIIRPKSYYVSDNLYIDFTVDLLGPKGLYDQYKNI